MKGRLTGHKKVNERMINRSKKDDLQNKTVNERMFERMTKKINKKINERMIDRTEKVE